MENKKTAMEWFMENLPNRLRNSILNGYRETLDTAIQMEKEQIETAIDECRHNYKHSDNYFNETYGKQTDRNDTKRESSRTN